MARPQPVRSTAGNFDREEIGAVAVRPTGMALEGLTCGLMASTVLWLLMLVFWLAV